jgi:4-amino-4-deoxy-L-arabinose transferase
VLQAILKGVAALLLLYLLLFFGLGDVGLLGPDEPRYASIGREMMFSGDWVTPRLWGDPWFEKPILLYWMAGAAFTVEIDKDLAPRLPVAIWSTLFLVFFYWWVRREFNVRSAALSTLLLASTAGWFVFSRLCVTDLPLSAAYSASILLCVSWLTGDRRSLVLPAGILLGIAILAKGLVPVVLSAPILWFGRRRFKDLLAYYGFAAMAAAPWYVLCAMENGMDFVHEFFWRHHFGRFVSSEMQHVQPFWFYVPVLLAGFLPWSPLLAMIGTRATWSDRKLRILLVTAGLGFLFFSASTNKLPGYLLPLFPLLAAVCGHRLSESRHGRLALVSCTLLLAIFPVAASVLPVAIGSGLSHAETPDISWWVAIPIAMLALIVWWLERGGRRMAASATIGFGVAAGVVYLVLIVFPVLDQQVSARGLWRNVSAFSHRLCVGDLHRSWRYGLNYYLMEPLPDCTDDNRPLRLEQHENARPVVVNR